MIPLYALLDSREDRYTFKVYNQSGGQERTYRFGSKEDQLRFQWTMTNFTFASDISEVKGAITRPGVKSEISYRSARVQLLMWDPEDEYARAMAAPPTSDARSNNQLLASRISRITATDIARRAEPVRVVQRSQRRVHTSVEITEAILPCEPLLIVYTKENGRAIYLCIESE